MHYREMFAFQLSQYMYNFGDKVQKVCDLSWGLNQSMRLITNILMPGWLTSGSYIHGCKDKNITQNMVCTITTEGQMPKKKANVC